MNVKKSVLRIIVWALVIGGLMFGSIACIDPDE